MINLQLQNQNQQNINFGKGTIIKSLPLDSIALAKQFFGNNPNKIEIKQAEILLGNINSNSPFKHLLEKMPDGDQVIITGDKGKIDIDLVIHPTNYKKYDLNFTDKTGCTDIKSSVSSDKPCTEHLIKSTITNFIENGIYFLDKHLIQQTKNS